MGCVPDSKHYLRRFIPPQPCDVGAALHSFHRGGSLEKPSSCCNTVLWPGWSVRDAALLLTPMENVKMEDCQSVSG